jgi:hypothetical protein
LPDVGVLLGDAEAEGVGQPPPPGRIVGKTVGRPPPDADAEAEADVEAEAVAAGVVAAAATAVGLVDVVTDALGVADPEGLAEADAEGQAEVLADAEALAVAVGVAPGAAAPCVLAEAPAIRMMPKKAPNIPASTTNPMVVAMPRDEFKLLINASCSIAACPQLLFLAR